VEESGELQDAVGETCQWHQHVQKATPALLQSLRGSCARRTAPTAPAAATATVVDPDLPRKAAEREAAAIKAQTATISPPLEMGEPKPKPITEWLKTAFVNACADAHRQLEQIWR
jgi:hypothetical protein